MPRVIPRSRWIGLLCVLTPLASCTEDSDSVFSDQPVMDSTLVDDPSTDVVVSAAGLEELKLHIDVMTPFCCDANARIFEAHLDGGAMTARITCSWDFDDGLTASGCSVTHRFNWRKEYSPTVTVTLEDGTTLVAVTAVVIGSLDGNGVGTTSKTLVVDAGDDVTVYEGTRVNLHGWAAGDTTSDVSFLWRELTGARVVLQNQASPTLTFEAAPTDARTRTLVFELTATSGELHATDTVTVTVLTPASDDVEIDYLAGPQAADGPGRYEVAWRFVDTLPKSDVRLSQGCCGCEDFDSGILTPDSEGVYASTILIPDDRTAWYRVHYTLGDFEHTTSAVHVNAPLDGMGLPPQSTVIWAFTGDRDLPESVATAIRTGLFTHVAFFVGNRVTANTLDVARTQKAIAIAREANLEVILVRSLWQNVPGPDTELSVLTDVDYYVWEIEQARQDALDVGAAYVALDTEPYGTSALFDHFKVNKDFLEEDYEAVAQTIAEVVSRTGKVDFVLPAGSSRPFHPYLALANLAEQRISEGTYYDNEENIDAISYPYAISGMFMNVTKEHDALPWKPYFLPGEVFRDKSYIWERKDGLFVWPRELHALEVAELLADSVGRCPENPDSQ